MATIVCPMRIRKLFKGGAATEAQKRSARIVALAWIKSQTSSLGPNDLLMIPNPNTGELEEWVKSGEPMVS